MGFFNDIYPSKKHLFFFMLGSALSNASKHLILLLLLVVVPAISAFAQSPPSKRVEFELVFVGHITEFDDKKQKDVPLADCSVNLYKGSTLVSTSSTGSNGKFKLSVPHDGDFVVQITKPG